MHVYADGLSDRLGLFVVGRSSAANLRHLSPLRGPGQSYPGANQHEACSIATIVISDLEWIMAWEDMVLVSGRPREMQSISVLLSGFEIKGQAALGSSDTQFISRPEHPSEALAFLIRRPGENIFVFLSPTNLVVSEISLPSGPLGPAHFKPNLPAITCSRLRISWLPCRPSRAKTQLIRGKMRLFSSPSSLLSAIRRFMPAASPPPAWDIASHVVVLSPLRLSVPCRHEISAISHPHTLLLEHAPTCLLSTTLWSTATPWVPVVLDVDVLWTWCHEPARISPL